MKKLLLLTLVLLGGFSTAFADAPTYSIYIKSSNPEGCYIHVWGATDGNTTGFGDNLSGLPSTTLHGTTYYVKSVKGSYNFLCDNGSWDADKKTSDQTNKSEDLYIEYNGGNKLTDIADYINSVNLPGSHNSWAAGSSVFTDNGDNSYTYELTPTATTTEFKLYAFTNWKGWGEVTLTPTGWFENSGGNIKLKDIGYSKYTLTATHDAEYNWSLDATVSSNDAYRHTIAGSSAILNEANDWTIYDANDMSDDDLDGVFTLVVRNKHLTAGTYEFKAFRGGNMGGWQVPSYGNPNKSITIDTEGYYDITYTLTCRDYTLTAQATTSKVNASVTALGIGTFCSEYALDFTGITDIKAYIIDGETDGQLNKTQVTGKVKAGTGLFIERGDGTAAEASADIPTTIYTTDPGTNWLKGVTTDTHINQMDGTNTNYILTTNGGATARFYKVNGTSGNNVGAGKAYLQVPGTPANEFFWFVDDTKEEEEVTAINAIANTADSNAAMFNLAGQRVNNNYKGVVVKNGKKFMVK